MYSPFVRLAYPVLQLRLAPPNTAKHRETMFCLAQALLNKGKPLNALLLSWLGAALPCFTPLAPRKFCGTKVVSAQLGYVSHCLVLSGALLGTVNSACA